MHGRPRECKPATELSAVKVSKLRSLQSQFLHFHHNHIYSKEALEINAKLIEANPEFMTAWNFRKLAFQHNISQSGEEAAPDRIKSIIDQELKVVESALQSAEEYQVLRSLGSPKMGAKQREYFSRAGTRAFKCASEARLPQFSCLELPEVHSGFYEYTG